MSATVRTIIRCDGVFRTGRKLAARCPAEEHSINIPSVTRRTLAAQGWVFANGQDFCPDPRHTRDGE